MKKIISKVIASLILAISIFIIFLPTTKAITTDFRTLDDTTTITVGKLTISNLSFIDNSNNSSLSFGITGTIYNPYTETVILSSTIYYYDVNQNLITATKNNQTLLPNQTSVYNNMSNLATIFPKNNVSDIYFYKLHLTISSNSNAINTTPSKNNTYEYYDYVIDKYDININVNENNTLDITEKITAYFKTPKHGIYRTIPLKNTIERLDGTTSTNIAQISNLTINN